MPHLTDLANIAWYLDGQITEGQLANGLGCDVVEARRQAKAFLDRAVEETPLPLHIRQQLTELEAALKSLERVNDTLSHRLALAEGGPS